MLLLRLCRNRFSFSIYNHFSKTIKRTAVNELCAGRWALGASKFSCLCSTSARNYSSVETTDSGVYNELVSTEFQDEDILDLDEGKHYLKQLLYQDTNDELLQILNKCPTVEKLLEAFSKHKDNFETQHVVQTVILLWDLCQNRMSKGSVVMNSDALEDILQYMLKFIPQMNIDERTCSLLYLAKIGVDSSHVVMRELIMTSLDVIAKAEEDTPLTALSRFAVAVNVKQDLHTYLVCQDVMPRVLRSLETCENIDDLRLITICLHNLILMVSKETLADYKDKVRDLIRPGSISKDCTKCVIKILNFLNFPHWSHQNNALVRDLLVMLNDHLENLSSRELQTVFRVFHSQMEPGQYLARYRECAEVKYQQTSDIEIFSNVVQFSRADEREYFTQKTKELFLEEYAANPTNISSAFFKMLRSLKISDLKLCSDFWSGTLRKILSNPAEQQNYRLLKHCHCYMHFNNNLGGTYRHEKFEKEISKFVIEELSNGISAVVPSKFSRLAAFIIAYGYSERPSGKIPDFIVNKIEEMQEQFKVIDCLCISRGVQIALEIRFRKFIPSPLALQLLRIDQVLNSCAERHLKTDITLSELNSIVRTFNNRKSSRKTPLYQAAIEKYNEILDGDLNSRIIRDISYNLSTSNFCAPQICERMLEYIKTNKDYVIGDTVEKALSCCYKLGYTPKSEDALYWSAEIIKRDFNYMSGLSIVQACLALCFYKTLPESLVNKVFCIEFIKRLEDEIKTCYSKAIYPERVLNQVMQLNRSVCLDYPEFQVPWFQQNYIEAQMSKKPIVRNRFHSDVKDLLQNLLKDEKLLACNYVTPYGYIVDFVIHLDKDKKPVPQPKESTLVDELTKVAILPLQYDSFCENDTTAMRGHASLRMRHLEILGWCESRLLEGLIANIAVKGSQKSSLFQIKTVLLLTKGTCLSLDTAADGILA